MTKKELEKENKELKNIIDFYFDCGELSLEELINKIKRQKRINERLSKILIFMSIMLLCGSFYLLGLAS